MTFPKLPKFSPKSSCNGCWTAPEAQLFDLFLQKKLGISPGLLMENGGQFLCQAIQEVTPPKECKVLLLIGPGNNGGDGLVALRHLHMHPTIRSTAWAPLGIPSRNGTPAADAAKVLAQLDIPISTQSPPDSFQPDLIVDCLFGIGLSRPVTGAAAEALHWAASRLCPILAADCPSGLDATSGKILGTALAATHTLSFVGTKTGFYRKAGPETCGTIQVAPIGVSGEWALAWLDAHRNASELK